MILTILEDQIHNENQMLADARKLMQMTRQAIEEFIDTIPRGDVSNATEIAKEISRLGSLCEVSLKTENRLGDLESKKLGIAQNGVAFDLDAARNEIGRKLDRLRDACGEGEVSG